MKPIHVAATIVRLFAICLAIYTITFFINTLIYFVSSEAPFVSVVSLLLAILLLVISIVLWKLPVSISRSIIGMSSHADDEQLQFTQGEFLSICIFALGLYFLYGLIGEGIYWYKFLNDPEFNEIQTRISLDQKASLWAFAFRSVFVLLLLTGNRLIVKAYKALRYGG